MPIFSTLTKSIPTVRLQVFVDDEPMREGPEPLGIDDYPYVWVAGTFVPECAHDGRKLQGLVRVAREPQRAMNRRISQMLDIIESQLRALRIIRENSIVNEEDAWKAGQGVTLVAKESAEAFDNIFRQMDGVDIQPGMFQVTQCQRI